MLGKKIKGLGEVILRVRDMEKMRTFYQQIIGLEMISASEKYTFFKIAEGYGGHHQTLALFSDSNLTAFGEKLGTIQTKNSSLHHFALEIDKSEYQEVISFCKKEKLAFVTETFEWINWKSVFVKDPEANIIEFVCHDEEIEK